MKKYKVAILGAGKIAKAMAKTLNALTEDLVCYAVASRDLDKAQTFAKEWGFEKAYGSYEEMLRDEEVELVYVATPHSFHFEHAKLCLLYGKPALVEKPFTVNVKQARELIRLSNEKKVFVQEAMWTRFLPARHLIKEIISSGAIGEVKSLEAEFSAPISNIRRLAEPELAGGALLDLGIYGLTFASMYFGNEIETVESECIKYETGVDDFSKTTYTYKDGKVAELRSSMTGPRVNEGILYGSKGALYVHELNNYSLVQRRDLNGKTLEDYKLQEQYTGYEYEVLASLKAIEEGRLCCPEMTHDMTLMILEEMDHLRKEWGVSYPFE